MKGKLVILDADGLMFHAGWAYRFQLNRLGELGAKKKLDQIIEGHLNRLGATHYLGFFGKDGVQNFRHAWATLKPYKGNRSGEDWMKYFKPILKKHFEDKWGFYPMGDLEADDAVIIAHHQYKEDWDIIHFSEDKDQRQLGSFKRYNPNKHNNPKKKVEIMDHMEGRKFFWAQMLHGDSTDNIEGIPGIGEGANKHPKVTPAMKARGEKSRNKTVMALWDLDEPTEEEMFNHVRQAYIDKYADEYLYYMVENYLLLKMVDKPSFDYPKDIKLREWKSAKIDKLATKTLIKL